MFYIFLSMLLGYQQWATYHIEERNLMLKKKRKPIHYKKVDKGIKKLKYIEMLYQIDQLWGTVLTCLAIIIFIASIITAGSTAYKYFICSKTTDGVVQEMEVRDFKDYGNPYLHSIQSLIRYTAMQNSNYPVIQYEVNNKKYTHKSNASLNIPENSFNNSVGNYITEIHYEPLHPEHSFIRMEIIMQVLRSVMLIILSITLVAISRIFKKPSFRYLDAIVKMRKEDLEK